MSAKDRPTSKPASDEYRSNYDKIFEQPKWIAQFDAQLETTYGISIIDSGWEADELYARWGDTEPVEAVFQLGDKYGLLCVKE